VSRWGHLVAAFLLAVALFAPRAALAATKLALPATLDGHVVDLTGTLSGDDVLDLDHRFEDIRLRSGFAIVALVTGPLQDEPIEDVGYRAINTWHVGDKGKDDGVVIVISPSDRRVRIETGKGVGGALTDLQSNDIIRNDMSPLLRQGKLHDAIAAGGDAIAKALGEGTPGARGSPRATPVARPMSLLQMALIAGGGLLFIILLIVSPTFRSIVLTLLFFGGGRGGGGGFGGGGGGGGGGSGYSGGGGSGGGGGSSDSY
jgi:uncharacterized protein